MTYNPEKVDVNVAQENAELLAQCLIENHDAQVLGVNRGNGHCGMCGRKGESLRMIRLDANGGQVGIGQDLCTGYLRTVLLRARGSIGAGHHVNKEVWLQRIDTAIAIL